MKITVLSTTTVKPSTEAWRLSRDTNQTTPFHEIATVDAPVNEMPAAVLHFEDFTILEREIFFTLRNHVAWARTSRVDDPLRFTVPTAWQQIVPTATIRASMQAAASGGASQDQWRGLLPVMAHTSWVARHDLRTLVKLAYYFDWLANELFSEQMTVRFYDVARAIERIINKFAPIETFNYKMERFLCTDYVAPPQPTMISHGGFTTVQTAIPLMLRAQLVRHRPILFEDNLFILMHTKPISEMNMMQPVAITAVAADAFWRAIITKRACWISQFDLWKPLVDLLGGTDVMLPCANAQPCPCVPDNMLRTQGKDPGPPCPILCDRLDIDKAPYRDAMLRYTEGRGAFWKDKIK